MKKLIIYILLLFPLFVNAQTGIKVAVPFIKNNPADNSITGYSDLLNGGLHQGLTYHSRDSLSTYFYTTLKPGMYFHVYNVGVVDSMYQWSGISWLPVSYGTSYTNGYGLGLSGTQFRIDTTVFFPVRGDNSTRTTGITTQTNLPSGFITMTKSNFVGLFPSYASGTSNAMNIINMRHVNNANNKGFMISNEIGSADFYLGSYDDNSLAFTPVSLNKIFTNGNLSFGSGINYSAGVASAAIGISNLTATGTPSSTTYLRGDNTWATIGSGTTANSLTLGYGFVSQPLSFNGSSAITGTIDSSIIAPKSYVNNFSSKAFVAATYLPINNPTSTGTGTFPKIAISGTGGGGVIDLLAQSSTPTTPAVGHQIAYADPTGRFTIMGSNGFAMSIAKGLLSASRVYNVPDSSGTLALESRVIPNSNLANSTISGVSLGGTLFGHSAGYGLSGSLYNGSSAQTWTADTTSGTGLVSKTRLANYIAKNFLSATAPLAYNSGTGIFSMPAAGVGQAGYVSNGTQVFPGIKFIDISGNTTSASLITASDAFNVVAAPNNAAGYNVIGGGTANTNRAVISMTRYGGSSNASPSAVSSGFMIGSIIARPFDGTNVLATASISFTANGSIATGSVPTDINFETGANGTRTTKFSILSNGVLNIGVTPASLSTAASQVLAINSGTKNVEIVNLTAVQQYVAFGDPGTQTAPGNIVTYTNGASDASFNISASLNVGTISGNVIQTKVTYTDETSTSRTVIFSPMSATSPGISTTGTVNYPVVGEIRAKASTTITVATELTTTSGTLSFIPHASIIKIR